MNKPFFSIITAIYNKSDCIENTISSLTSQTYSDIEILLIDDHSSDDTFIKIKNIAKSDSRIKVIKHKKNMGVHQARTTGINYANGKFILFLDGDDYLEKNACQVIYDTIQKKSADVYEFDYYILPKKEYHTIQNDNRNRITALLSEKKSYPATIWNKAYNSKIVKKAFTNTPFIPQNGPEDLFESITMAYYSQNYYKINSALYNYSIGNGVSTKNRTFHDNEIYFENMKLVVDLTKDFFVKKKSNYVKLINEFEKRLARDAIYWFIKTLTIKNDQLKSFLILPKYFSADTLQPYFDQLYSNAQKYKQGKFNFKYFCKYIYKTILRIKENNI